MGERTELPIRACRYSALKWNISQETSPCAGFPDTLSLGKLQWVQQEHCTTHNRFTASRREHITPVYLSCTGCRDQEAGLSSRSRAESTTLCPARHLLTCLRLAASCTVTYGIVVATVTLICRRPDLRVGRTNSSYGDSSFAAAGPRLWNRLPLNVRRHHLSYHQFRPSIFSATESTVLLWLFDV